MPNLLNVELLRFRENDGESKVIEKKRQVTFSNHLLSAEIYIYSPFNNLNWIPKTNCDLVKNLAKVRMDKECLLALRLEAQAAYIEAFSHKDVTRCHDSPIQNETKQPHLVIPALLTEQKQKQTY